MESPLLGGEVSLGPVVLSYRMLDIGVYSVEENRMCWGLLFRAEVTESYTNQTIAPLGAEFHSLSQ